MSMMWVIPARATSAMFSGDQIPPPTAIRPVTHVISMRLIRLLLVARCRAIQIPLPRSDFRFLHSKASLKSPASLPNRW